MMTVYDENNNNGDKVEGKGHKTKKEWHIIVTK